MVVQAEGRETAIAGKQDAHGRVVSPSPGLVFAFDPDAELSHCAALAALDPARGEDRGGDQCDVAQVIAASRQGSRHDRRAEEAARRFAREVAPVRDARQASRLEEQARELKAAIGPGRDPLGNAGVVVAIGKHALPTRRLAVGQEQAAR